MANLRWRGDAPAAFQVTQATPANVESGDQFVLTINGKSISYTATAPTVADVTAGLAAAWNASTVPEHAEITASDLSSYVKLVADKPGVPFTVTGAALDGSGTNTQSLSLATTVSATGPNDWNAAANWSTGTVPANGDDVFIENSSVPILYGLNQATITLNSLNIAQSFSGTIGLPRTSAGGYIEYRDPYLAIKATRVVIGQGEGPGSGRLKLDTGSGQITLDLLNSGSALDVNAEAVQWKGTHAANVVNLTKGGLAIAREAGDVATVSTLRVGFRTNAAGDAVVRGGAGMTIDTIEQAGGLVTISSDVTTVRQTGGELVVTGGSISSLSLDGGALRFQSTGAIGTANVGARGTLDFSRDLRARTVTTCNVYAGGRLADPFKTVTFDSGIHLVHTTLNDVSVDLGTDRILSVS